MNYVIRVCGFLVVVALSVSSAALCQTVNDSDALDKPHITTKVPSNVILVKGAWSSASDSVTALPESGNLNHGVFRDKYFGITYPLPPDWIEKYAGPPPSDSGRYVLALMQRPDTYKGDARGNILITAQDMFFTPLPADNALQMVDFSRNHLQADYSLEAKPTHSQIAGRDFAGLAYWSPIAGLHWYVLATEIRCHTVEFVFMNRDQQTLESTVAELNKIRLPQEASSTGGSGGGAVPVCIKDYASGETLLERVDPFFGEQRYNSIPVRIIIDKRGRVKHIHFLSAFPDQAKAISDALRQWRFKPYVRNGQRLEVETGIMFGRTTAPVAPTNDGRGS
ncbi:MAG TPA: hypothetical protein VMB26_14240 [Candidatus Binataceae bacterium]|nr:hypothetical protein [Candidatus Binataceae bacterium]